MEDAAAVVVNQDDGGFNSAAPQGQQAVQVMVESQVANHQRQRAASRCGCAQGAGNRAVNAAGPSIGEYMQVSRIRLGKLVEMAYRQAAGNVKQAFFG